MKYYRIFDLTLASEIEFSNLLSSEQTTPDYILKLGTVIADSPVASIGLFTQASASELYHEISGVARFHCKDNIITVDKNCASDAQDIKVFLLDTIFAYLLNQAGYLLLKGSAVKTETGALLIASNSSNGCSALAATLQQEFSYPIISDGLLIIKKSLSAPKTIVLVPNNTPLTLWQDSCKHLSLDYTKQLAVRANLLKYEFPIAISTDDELPISNLTHLVTHNADTVCCQTLSATDKIDRILELTHYPQLVTASNNTRDSFKLAIQLANTCNISNVTRPQKYDYSQFALQVHEHLNNNSLIPAGGSNE